MKLGLKNYHHLQLCFAGYSESGKTTLVEKLVKRLSGRFKIGYAKHDAHSFQMDEEGKDTHRICMAGAHAVHINNAGGSAYHGAESLIPSDVFARCDFVFIEGFKFAEFDKILLIDPARKIMEDVGQGLVKNVVATAGVDANGLPGLPHFNRDDIDGLCAFIVERLEKQVRMPLYGLVLTGGKSSRMKTDKSRLVYNGLPQAEHTHDLLAGVCEKTFISCRADQAYDRPVIQDTYLGLGPMGGILSAMREHPDKAFLVAACDLPRLDSATLKDLVARRNPYKVATTFLSPEEQLPEPLCSIYEPCASRHLLKFLAVGIDCPRKMLLNANVQRLQLANPEALHNCNTPEEYAAMTTPALSGPCMEEDAEEEA